MNPSNCSLTSHNLSGSDQEHDRTRGDTAPRADSPTPQSRVTGMPAGLRERPVIKENDFYRHNLFDLYPGTRVPVEPAYVSQDALDKPLSASPQQKPKPESGTTGQPGAHPGPLWSSSSLSAITHDSSGTGWSTDLHFAHPDPDIADPGP